MVQIKLVGSTVNATLETEGIAVTLVFIDSTQGWLVTDSGLQSEAPTASIYYSNGWNNNNLLVLILKFILLQVLELLLFLQQVMPQVQIQFRLYGSCWWWRWWWFCLPGYAMVVEVAAGGFREVVSSGSPYSQVLLDSKSFSKSSNLFTCNSNRHLFQ